MAKTIDLTAKLDNSRPLVKIAEGKIYEVDNRKTTILKLDQQLNAAGQGDVQAIDKVITTLIGKDAVKEIEAMDLSLTNYFNIIIALMAAISDESFEVAEARFLAEKSQAFKLV